METRKLFGQKAVELVAMAPTRWIRTRDGPSKGRAIAEMFLNPKRAEIARGGRECIATLHAAGVSAVY